ncbi:MAG: GTPase Era [Hyphomicrobiales bacterium]
MVSSQIEVKETRCGVVALIGAPNVGKSTLLNQLVGSKISIVTHKVQTTRARVRAIAIEDESQVIFVDTPGIFAPKRMLDKAMVEAAWGGAADADITVLLLDARAGLDEETEEIIKGLEKAGIKAHLAINKIDLIPNEQLLPLTQSLTERFAFGEVFLISALSGDGVEKLRTFLAETSPAGPWLYPEDQIADIPMRLLAAEVTREKLYLRLHQELPYASTVETEKWSQLKDGSVRIEQVVFVERSSQKKIMLGKNGDTIKAIGRAARLELEEMLETKVHLFLFVKVRGKWAQDPDRYHHMGLELPSGY